MASPWKKRLACLAVGWACALLAPTSQASVIYKCTFHTGSVTYSTERCDKTAHSRAIAFRDGKAVTLNSPGGGATSGDTADSFMDMASSATRKMAEIMSSGLEKAKTFLASDHPRVVGRQHVQPSSDKNAVTRALDELGALLDGSAATRTQPLFGENNTPGLMDRLSLGKEPDCNSRTQSAEYFKACVKSFNRLREEINIP